MQFAPAFLIARKRDGGILNRSEILDFIDGVTSGKWSDAQVGAMLMAVYLRGLSFDEIVALTDAMMESGEQLELSGISPFRIDKHSTGGVGDKVSLVFAPLVAALGIRVPMLSGRGLGHTGGTLDKLESIPGLELELSPEQFRAVLSETGMVIAAAQPRLVPADRRLYAIRDITATVDCLGLIVSSIMSKKLAVKADGLVLDVKTGSGAFARSEETALELCRALVGMGTRAGRPVMGFITRMDQPLGRRIGNALEVSEALDALRGEGPTDLMDVTFALAEAAMEMAGIGADRTDRRKALSAAIASGQALEVFTRWVGAQKGDTRCCENPQRLPQAPLQEGVQASRTGYLTAIDAFDVGLAVHMAGAGRNHPGEAVDPGAGVVLHRKQGERVRAGDLLATLYAGSGERLAAARPHLMQAMRIGDSPVESEGVVVRRVDAEERVEELES
ncbi:MAG: thymidine phosphorylase [Acidobacteriota bacterium]|jgi:pyrimidine-nucleoside phosphorylase|nr:thymidine phosphorylase [Acidobacteriota bacterium]